MAFDFAAFVAANAGVSQREIARRLTETIPDLNFETARGIVRRNSAPSVQPVATDKKVGSTNWREMCAFAEEARRIKSQASWSQSHAKMTYDVDKLGIIMLSDLHALSFGTDHSNILRVVDEILEVPNLKIGLLGDLLQMSIKLRSVQEVGDNILPADLQMAFLESFLDELKDRIVFCTWDNHAVEREEKQSGVSMFKYLASRRVTYFNGIGHIDITVGDETYKLAVTHKVRGRSMMNPLHGQMRYMRFEGIDREIMFAGDSHTPGTMKYTDGAITRLAGNCGSTQVNSGYANRYFSLYTHPIFPILTLRSDRHDFDADWTLKSYLERQ